MSIRVNTLLDVKLEGLRGLSRMVSILGVGKGVHLITHVVGVPETAQVPSCILNHGELPPTVSEGVRPDAFEDLCGRDHRPEPGLARKQVVERVLEHPHMDRV